MISFISFLTLITVPMSLSGEEESQTDEGGEASSSGTTVADSYRYPPDAVVSLGRAHRVRKAFQLGCLW